MNRATVTGLTLRNASLADARLLLDWRNDPEARRWSRNSQPIDEATHRQWLVRNLPEPAHRLLIAQLDEVPVGMVRLDAGSAGTELCWSVAVQWRGQGLGRA